MPVKHEVFTVLYSSFAWHYLLKLLINNCHTALSYMSDLWCLMQDFDGILQEEKQKLLVENK